MPRPDKVEIKNNDTLLRRVPYKDPKYIKDDGSLSSLAYTPRNQDRGLSVNIERLTTYKESILNIRRFRLFAHKAIQFRELNLECEHDPLPENNAHALVVGMNPNNRKIPRKLARSATRIKYPD